MMPPNKSEINGNRVGPHGKVNNVIQTIRDIIINISVPDAEPTTLARIIEQFLRESGFHQIAQLFGPEVGKYLVGEYHDRSTFTPDYAHRPHNVRQSYCFVRNAELPESDIFDRNLSGYLSHYPNTKTTRCVVQILNYAQGQTLSSWITSRKINNLLLDLSPRDNQRSHWTTNFTLEVIGRINWLNFINGGAAAAPVVAHFCSAHASHGIKWQETAVRDLLAQLRRARGDKLVNNHNCKVPGEDDRVFHVEMQDIRDFWNLLLHTVAKAGIKLLYVILDNFDSLHGRVDEEILEKFRENISRFIERSQEREVLVKLLVTSQSPKTVDYFTGFDRINLTQDVRERFKF